MTTWFGEAYGFYAQPSASATGDMGSAVEDRLVGWWDSSRGELFPGRRFRIFCALIRPNPKNINTIIAQSGETLLEPETRLTYGEAYRILRGHSGLSDIPLRVTLNGEPSPVLHAIPENYVWERTKRDPELHPALQDLAFELNEDVHEACFAFDDPSLYFPGIDERIEPVTDDHVSFVIWAMQRELSRELRPPETATTVTERLPAVPLAKLPWRVQRALVERRRYRYVVEYGITHECWEAGKWSLWNIPEDSDFIPRKHLRKAGKS